MFFFATGRLQKSPEILIGRKQESFLRPKLDFKKRMTTPRFVLFSELCRRNANRPRMFLSTMKAKVASKNSKLRLRLPTGQNSRMLVGVWCRGEKRNLGFRVLLCCGSRVISKASPCRPSFIPPPRLTRLDRFFMPDAEYLQNYLSLSRRDQLFVGRNGAARCRFQGLADDRSRK